jgi:3-hydroxybutyrate dehydrogenase
VRLQRSCCQGKFNKEFIGINLAFVKGIHALGCSVLIGDIALHKDAQAWLRTLPSSARTQIVFQQTDVTKWAQLEALFDIYTQNSNLPSTVPDIVVAGAGIYEASSAGFWDDRDQDGHYKLLDINMIHPLKLTRISIRRMQQAKKPGVILHESSIVAQKPSAVLPLYAISKAGLSHFVRSMGPIEALSGIKVVAVAPG